MILYKKIFHSYNRVMRVILFFIFCFVFLAGVEARDCDLTTPVSVFKPKYAKNFSIHYYHHFRVLHSGTHRYLLSDASNNCQTDMIKIITPVKKTVMMSTTYLPALELIKEVESLIAFQGKRYIVSPVFNLDSIKDVSFKINPEELLKLKADLIMGYDSNLSTDKQRSIFKSLNIPVVLNKDFEETSPLGRAEWLIFTSSFFNKEKIAQTIFNKIAEDYHSLKLKNAKAAQKPRVLIGEIQNGFWVTSGGLSDQGQMIADAGAEMILARPSASIQNISLEELSQIKMPVDFWLPNNMWKTREQLQSVLKKDSRYSLISPKNIYNNNLITNKFKFNDFWETGMQRPDLVLLDLSAMFHPDLYLNHKLKWYQQI